MKSKKKRRQKALYESDLFNLRIDDKLQIQEILNQIKTVSCHHDFQFLQREKFKPHNIIVYVQISSDIKSPEYSDIVLLCKNRGIRCISFYQQVPHCRVHSFGFSYCLYLFDSIQVNKVDFSTLKLPTIRRNTSSSYTTSTPVSASSLALLSEVNDSAVNYQSMLASNLSAQQNLADAKLSLAKVKNLKSSVGPEINLRTLVDNYDDAVGSNSMKMNIHALDGSDASFHGAEYHSQAAIDAFKGNPSGYGWGYTESGGSLGSSGGGFSYGSGNLGSAYSIEGGAYGNKGLDSDGGYLSGSLGSGRAGMSGDISGIGLELGSGGAMGSGSGMGSGNGVGFGLGSGSGMGSEGGMGLGQGSGIGMGSEGGMGLGLGSGSGMGLGLGSGSGMGLGLGSGSGMGLDSGLGLGGSMGLIDDLNFASGENKRVPALGNEANFLQFHGPRTFKIFSAGTVPQTLIYYNNKLGLISHGVGKALVAENHYIDQFTLFFYNDIGPSASDYLVSIGNDHTLSGDLRGYGKHGANLHSDHAHTGHHNPYTHSRKDIHGSTVHNHLVPHSSTHHISSFDHHGVPHNDLWQDHHNLDNRLHSNLAHSHHENHVSWNAGDHEHINIHENPHHTISGHGSHVIPYHRHSKSSYHGNPHSDGHSSAHHDLSSNFHGRGIHRSHSGLDNLHEDNHQHTHSYHGHISHDNTCHHENLFFFNLDNVLIASTHGTPLKFHHIGSQFYEIISNDLCLTRTFEVEEEMEKLIFQECRRTPAQRFKLWDSATIPDIEEDSHDFARVLEKKKNSSDYSHCDG